MTSKKSKTFETTSHNTPDSAHGGFNLKDEADDLDDEEEEIREVRPMGRDKAKNNASSSITVVPLVDFWASCLKNIKRVHYNIRLYPRRHDILFPDDMSSGNGCLGRIQGDSFPGSLPWRQRRAHIFFDQQKPWVVKDIPQRHVAGDSSVINYLNVILGIANQHGNGNVVAARAKGNGNLINGNPIRCYNCQGVDHYASNCIVKPRKRDVAYLQKQMQIAQKEEAWIQLTSEEFNFMAAVGACEETERANANCTLENNLQQESTSGTQFDKALVYDSDGSTEVHLSENCHDNDIFNMFTQKEQYTELLEPIPEPHQVQQNDSNVISAVSSVEQGGGTIEQHSTTVEETLEKVNSVNRKMKETNANLTTELARYKNQEKCFEISQEKYDKLERCYQKSVYQEQCLTKKINSLHLSSGKQITALNEEISNLNNQLSK
ncbi:hypothetical protein Tco_0965507 [Tanacetum coccineum]